jgi:hypothetical protein
MLMSMAAGMLGVSASSIGLQTKPPIEKEGLLRSLSRKALTSNELIQEIKSRGVSFQLTTVDDENEIRKSATYLRKKGIDNLIAAIRNNFRPRKNGGSEPGGKLPAIYRVRVTLLDPQRHPVEDAKVWSTVGGEPKKVAGGWQFDIPSASVPMNGQVTFYATKESAFLGGETPLLLGADPNPAVTIDLGMRVSEVNIRGIILDGENNAVGEVRVNVVGYESEAVITHPHGGFVLPAHAAVEKQVLLHAEKPGYQSVNEYHPAGNEPATIVLKRK